MPDFYRYRVPGGCYFFTVNLLERRGNTMLTDRIDLLRDAVRRVGRTRPFSIDAWIVLPDHLHAVWTLPPGDDDFSTRWRLIKTFFARGLPKAERLSRVRRADGERGIWQRRFWEHAIRNEEDYAAHMDYVHFNPASTASSPRQQTGRIPRSDPASRADCTRPTGLARRRRRSRPANAAAENMRRITPAANPTYGLLGSECTYDRGQIHLNLLAVTLFLRL